MSRDNPFATPRGASGLRPNFLDLELVERDVYWRVLSRDYQAEQFEVFHRSLVTRHGCKRRVTGTWVPWFLHGHPAGRPT
jgi:hypothetical protein